MIKKIIKYLLGIGLLVFFTWTFFYLYEGSQKAPVVYETVKPIKNNIIKKTVATGSITPRKEVAIKSQVSGILEALFIEAGKPVQQGQMIARIKIIPNMAALNEAENRVTQAKLNLEQTTLEFDRSKKLLDKEVISAADFQPIESRYKINKQEVVAAENNLQIVKEGVIKNAGGAGNTIIRSTISGMVLDVPLKEGNSVIESNTFNEGSTIATVADMSSMIFEGKVDESEVGKIHTGMDLMITVGAIEDEQFKAKLEYISPKGQSENGAIQFVIKASLDGMRKSFLRAGYSANADIILDRRDSVWSIPESVLQFDKEEVFVEVKNKKGGFDKKKIKTGLSDGIHIEIKEGLDPDAELKIPSSGGGEEAS
jgi:HlyD family secretion protein